MGVLFWGPYMMNLTMLGSHHRSAPDVWEPQNGSSCESVARLAQAHLSAASLAQRAQIHPYKGNKR